MYLVAVYENTINLSRITSIDSALLLAKTEQSNDALRHNCKDWSTFGTYLEAIEYAELIQKYKYHHHQIEDKCQIAIDFSKN